jgi:hypothetical protein
MICRRRHQEGGTDVKWNLKDARLRSVSVGSWKAIARGTAAVGILAILVALALAPRGSAGAATGCKTSGPTSGAYAITLCFTDPLDGDRLAGAEPVSVSVSVTGSNPGI